MTWEGFLFGCVVVDAGGCAERGLCWGISGGAITAAREEVVPNSRSAGCLWTSSLWGLERAGGGSASIR